MEREGHDNVRFFLGKEVEHTPAYGMTTLFVVGLQPEEDIKNALAKTTYDTRHIYFGANQSFPKGLDATDLILWENMIVPFLKSGYMCTLDIDVSDVEMLAESLFPEYNNFIPMISVKLPYLQLLGYNATIKLDDKDFRATNPGVWCHMLHDLKDRSKFTDWSKYTSDLIIE